MHRPQQAGSLFSYGRARAQGGTRSRLRSHCSHTFASNMSHLIYLGSPMAATIYLGRALGATIHLGRALSATIHLGRPMAADLPGPT